MTKLEEQIINDAELSPSADIKERILCKAKLAMLEEEPVQAKAKKKINLFAILSPVIASLLVIASLSTFFGLKYEHYETVYIDVNPSIELDLNRFNTVVDYRLVNEDSQEIFKDVNFKNKSLDDSIELVLTTLDEAEILTQSYVNINAISKSEDKTQSILNEIDTKVNEIKERYNYIFNYNGEEVSEEDVEEAGSVGLNPGKYKIILKIILLDSKETIEDLKDKTMAELLELLEELTNKKA